MQNIPDKNIVVALTFLARNMHTIEAAHGFLTPVPENLLPMFKGNKIALMHSELSEALEAVRKPRQDDHCPMFSNEVVELADCVIRVLSYCYHFNLPLADAILAKAEFNRSRPFMHGKLS